MTRQFAKMLCSAWFFLVNAAMIQPMSKSPGPRGAEWPHCSKLNAYADGGCKPAVKGPEVDFGK